MRLIDKQYRQRYLFPARWRWDCTTSCLGETDPQGLQGSAFSDCIKTYKNILFQKSRCYEASLGRGLSNHHPPQSQKLSALWLLFVFPLDFFGLSFVLSGWNREKEWICDLLDEISDCPGSISHLWMQEPWCFLSCHLLLYQPFSWCKKVCLCNVPTKQKKCDYLVQVHLLLAKQKHGHVLFFVGFRTVRGKIAGLFIPQDLLNDICPTFSLNW